MALFNEILVGRFNRALQKFLDMKGEPPSPQLAPEIGFGFGFPIEEDLDALFGWRDVVAAGQIAATGLTAGAYLLRNPSTSNVIGLITGLTVTIGGDAIVTFSVGADPGDLNNVGSTIRTGFGLDRRYREGTAFNPTGSNTVAGGNLDRCIWDYQLVAATPFNFDLSRSAIPLAPGDAFKVRTNAINSALTVALFWKERFLEASERSV